MSPEEQVGWTEEDSLRPPWQWSPDACDQDLCINCIAEIDEEVLDLLELDLLLMNQSCIKTLLHGRLEISDDFFFLMRMASSSQQLNIHVRLFLRIWSHVVIYFHVLIYV